MGVGRIGVALTADHAVRAQFGTDPEPLPLLSHLQELLLPAIQIRLGEFIREDVLGRYAECRQQDCTQDPILVHGTLSSACLTQ
jgi:hypothetical protein